MDVDWAEIPCLFCGQFLGTRGREHIFPQSIGGGVTIPLVCVACNNSLGLSADAEVTRNVFLSVARRMTGLADAKTAYRGLMMEHPQTGAPLRIVDDQVTASERKLADGSFVGPLGVMSGPFYSHIKHTLGKDIAEDTQRRIASGQKIIDLPEELWGTREWKGQIEVKLTGQNIFPHAMLAKIAYELIACHAYPSPLLVDLFRFSTFKVDSSSQGMDRITLRESFFERSYCITPGALKDDADLEAIGFEPGHWFSFGVGERGIAYLFIGFFGRVSYVIALGPPKDLDDRHSDLIDRMYYCSPRDSVFFIDDSVALPEKVRDYISKVAYVRWRLFTESENIPQDTNALDDWLKTRLRLGGTQN